jgi:hypothetical protein
MEISQALEVIFTAVEKIRCNRKEHQLFYEAEQAILKFVKEAADAQDKSEVK